MTKQDYYVYLHRRADDNEVFYVGKGKGHRAKRTADRSAWWHRVVAKHGIVIEYVETGMFEDSAFDLEIELIRFYRECGHQLVNLTDGGEGWSGYKYSEEDKKKLSVARLVTSQKVPVICSNGMTFESMKKACDWLEEEQGKRVNSGAIHNACSGRSQTFRGFAWRFLRDGKPDESNHRTPIDAPVIRANYPVRKIRCCCTGQVFDSATAASNWLKSIGKNTAKTYIGPILRCCKGESKQSHGYKWEYA